jgi:hypothetical protein
MAACGWRWCYRKLLSLRPLILAILARKFLGTYRASPKHASIVFFDLREAANVVIEF